MTSYAGTGKAGGTGTGTPRRAIRKTEQLSATPAPMGNGILDHGGPIFPIADGPSAAQFEPGDRAIAGSRLTVQAKQPAIPPALRLNGERGVIQRVTLQELYTAWSVDQLAKLATWLGARAGRSTTAWENLLALMTAKEVEGAVAAHAERMQAESRIGTLDDIIEQGGDLEKKPGKEIDSMIRSSAQIAAHVSERAAQGIKVADDVVVLGDAAFAARHWEEKQYINRAAFAELSTAETESHRLRDASIIDRVHGFQSDQDGKIYMRDGEEESFHIAVHESVHKYGGASFKANLGHLLNEAATETIPRLLLSEKGSQVFLGYYPDEVTLLRELMATLRISSADLYAAYFNDDFSAILNFLTALAREIGDEGQVKFCKAKSVSEAKQIFETGQKKVRGQ